MRAGWDDFVFPGDPTKAAEVFFRVATMPDPPLQLPIGRDAIAMARKVLAELGDAVALYESWSEDLELESGEERGDV